MSNQAINWALSDTKTKGSERIVLLVLANRANDKNQCWPGFDSISRDAKISRRQVIKIIKRLESLGIITIQHRSDGPKNITNFYTLNGVVSPMTLGSVAEDTSTSVAQFTRGSVAEDTQTQSINPNIEPKRNLNTSQKKAKAATPDPGLYVLALALSEVSGVDLKANNARIYREAKELAKASGVTPEKIREDYGPGGLWYKADWRGRMGSPPSLNQVRSTWGTLNMHQPMEKGGHRATGFDTSRATIAKLLQEVNYGDQ
jgi:hypothetical protein